MSDVFSFRRVLVAIAACWFVSIVAGLIGVPDYQRGALAGMTGMSALCFMWAIRWPR